MKCNRSAEDYRCSNTFSTSFREKCSEYVAGYIEIEGGSFVQWGFQSKVDYAITRSIIGQL